MQRSLWFLTALLATLFTAACNQPATMQRNTAAAPPQQVAETAPAVPATQTPPPSTPKVLEMPAPSDASSPQAVDINTASMDQLRKMPFIGDSYAMKIIQGRPYKRKDELSSRNILPPHVYQKAKDYLIASGGR